MTIPPVNGSSMEIHRALPRDIDSEKALLGCVFRQWTLIDEFQIRGEWFAPQNQVIFDEIAALGSCADMVTLVVSLRDKNQLEQVGGPGYVAEIFGTYVSPAQAHYFVDRVKGAFIRREVIRIGTEAASIAYEHTTASGIDLVSDLEQGVTKLVCDIETRATQEQTFKEMVMDALADIERAYETRGAIQGLPSGIPALDKLTGGFRNKHLIVVAARPSEGKTALGLHIADTCLVQKRPVGFISLEMPGRELAERLLSRDSKIDSSQIRDGFIGPRDFPNITASVGRIARYLLDRLR